MSLVERTEELLKVVTGNSNARLNDFQVRAIELIEKSGNYLVVGPTGIGKTLVGVAAILKYGRGFYLAPLRSLMAEKYSELRKMFPDKKVVLTNKDYSIPRRVLKDADVRVLSPYKFLLYLDYLEPSDGVVVVDEIHKISSDPEMEVAITAMKTAGFNVVGLSATVHDDDIPRMAKWLNALVIKADESRPVPIKHTEIKLELGFGGLVVERGGNYFKQKEKFSSKEDVVAELVARIRRIDPSGGIMVWCPTRHEADEYALRIAHKMSGTNQCVSASFVVSSEHDKILSRVACNGVLIHHGGISPKNREVVEDLFKSRKAEVVVSCYTLSHGVNFPVRYLVMTSLFDHENKPLDPSTFHQISGRAGRPGLDKYGEVLVVVVGDLESCILTKLLQEKATRVKSNLYNPWTLTKLTAQQLAMRKRVDSFVDFLKETYYVQVRGIQGFEEIKKLAEEVLVSVVEAYFELKPNGEVKPKGKKEFFASIMGLHPEEWAAHEPLIAGDYRSTVEKIVDASMKAVGLTDSSIRSQVISYGFMSTYLGSWKVREVAEMSQTMLDALALYVRRVYGWSSIEFSNAKTLWRCILLVLCYFVYLAHREHLV